MNEPRILNNVNPTTDEVRAWGYDENVLFMEQDEDLILHDLEYIPVLLELAADSSCPKQEYAANIVAYYSQLVLLHAKRSIADGIVTIAHRSPHSQSPLVQHWRDWFLELYDRLVNPSALTQAEAERVGWLLSVGYCCRRDFAPTGRVVAGFTEFLASTQSFRLYVYIRLATGEWRTQTHTPWPSTAPN